MYLDSALYLDKALDLSQCAAPLHLAQNASILQQQQSPLCSMGQLHDIVPESRAEHQLLRQEMHLISGVGDFC